MTMTKLKLAVVSALIVTCAAAPLILQHQARNQLRQENLALRQENDQLAQRLAQVAAENLRFSNLVARSDQSVSADKASELLRLRAEVARLRADAKGDGRLHTASANNPGDASIMATAQILA